MSIYGTWLGQGEHCSHPVLCKVTSQLENIHVSLLHPTTLVHSFGQEVGTSVISEANASETPQNIEKLHQWCSPGRRGALFPSNSAHLLWGCLVCSWDASHLLKFKFPFWISNLHAHFPLCVCLYCTSLSLHCLSPCSRPLSPQI